MIKKIIILGLVILGAFIFYKKFMADTLDPFFGKMKRDKGKIDLFQQKIPDSKIYE